MEIMVIELSAYSVMVLLSLLLVAPRLVARPFISATVVIQRSVVGLTVLGTLSVLFIITMVAALVQVGKLKGESDTGSRGFVVAEQRAKAYLTSVLSGTCCLLLVMIRKLAVEMHARDKLAKSHEALKRQAEGLSAEYSRATAKREGSDAAQEGSSDMAQEVAALKARITTLLTDKTRLQDELESAQSRAALHEKDVAALKSQAAGLAKEYDRVVEEREQLERRLATADASFSAAACTGGSKKDA